MVILTGINERLLRVTSWVLLISCMSFAAIDWSLNRGQASFAELKLPKSVFEMAHQRGGVAHSQQYLEEWFQFQRYESPPEQGLAWNSIQYKTKTWSLQGQIYEYEDLQGVNSEGDFTGDYASSINDLSLGYSFRYHESDIDLELHYIDYRLAQAYSQGGYINLGLRTEIADSWVYGWRARNIGLSSKYDRREVFLPIQIVTGLVYKINQPLQEIRWEIEPGIDIEYQNDEGASVLGGLGVSYQNTLALRTSLKLIDPRGKTQWIPKQAGVYLYLDFGFLGYGYQNMEYLSGAHLIEFGVNI